ncbi:MAG TPA: hypothetical protein VLA68_02080 [Nitrososphaera sp.]|nr:hypothetical protein [Nitrososphaera sp.]
MASDPGIFKRERTDKEDYWRSELRSLGIEPKRKSELNDRDELQALAENIKQTFYQDYKAAYANNSEQGEVE